MTSDTPTTYPYFANRVSSQGLNVIRPITAFSIILTEEEPSLTTIQVDTETRAYLESKKHGREGVYKVVRRMIQGISDVYIEFVLVDNELPRTHTAVFQMGENSQSLYFFDGSLPAGRQCNPIDPEKVQELIKQPKPNITLTREEAQKIFNVRIQDIENDFADVPETKRVLAKLKTFLEIQPSGGT